MRRGKKGEEKVKKKGKMEERSKGEREVESLSFLLQVGLEIEMHDTEVPVVRDAVVDETPPEDVG